MPSSKTSKKEILKKSFEVFSKKGYYHSTISDLSRACGIEKPHFYYYFKDKKEIMLSVLECIHGWVKDNLFCYAFNEELNAPKRMEYMLKGLREVHENKYNGCIFANTALETANNEIAFAPVIKQHFEAWTEAALTIYSLIYRKEQAEMKAKAFFNELNGALIMVKIYKNMNYIDDFIENKINELR